MKNNNMVCNKCFYSKKCEEIDMEKCFDEDYSLFATYLTMNTWFVNSSQKEKVKTFRNYREFFKFCERYNCTVDFEKREITVKGY